MAVAALILMNHHRGVGRMAANAERRIQDMPKSKGRVVSVVWMDDAERALVPMTVQTVDFAVVGIGDDHRHRGAGGEQRIDITSGVVAGAAATEMGAQDFSKVGDHMTIGAGLGIALAEVGCWIDLDVVIDGAARQAMVMTIEVSGVTGGALAAASDGRGDQGAVASGVVACGAPFWGMNLVEAYKWRGCRTVATDAVAGGRDGHGICFDLVAVVMGVGVEVGGMAFGAGAASAGVDRGVAMAVNSGDSGSVRR